MANEHALILFIHLLIVPQERNDSLSPLYSLRRATTGSTRDARRAGAKHARVATPRRITDTAVIVGMRSGRKP